MIRAPCAGLAEGERALPPEVGHYVARVRRLGEGGRFIAFDPQRTLEADAEIIRVTGREIVVRIGPLRAAILAAAREVTWLQALPKGEKMDGIVRDATELGATRIVPVVTQFTVVKLDGPRREARRQRWERIAREAARQCGRGDAPIIDTVIGWDEAISTTAGAASFCLYERAQKPLAPEMLAAVEAGSPLVFAAGPEGGLSLAEVASAAAHRFEIVSLGALVMRTETVAAATLGALLVMGGLVLGSARS